MFAKDIDSINVRRELIEKCEVEAVIQLGTSTFAPYTKQPTSIIVFNKKKASSKVWFFELNNDGFSETGKRYSIDKNDIPELRMLWSDKGDSKNSFIIQYSKINKDNYKLFLNYYKTFTPIKNPIELSCLCKSFILGHTPSKADSSFYGGKYLWTTISDMKGKYIFDTVHKLSEKGINKIGVKRLIKKDSLLMSFKLTLGKTAFAGKDLYTNEAICMLDLKPEYNTEEIKEYLFHVLPLVNYIPFAQRAAKGYTLNKDLLPTVEIPFPDIKIRKKIVDTKMSLQMIKIEIENQLQKNKEQYEIFIKSEILGY